MLIGALILLGIGIVLLVPAIPSIGLRLAGFEAIDTATIQITPETAPVIQNAQTTSNTTLSAGTYGSRVLPPSSAYTIQTGTADNGASIAQINLSESSIQTLCMQFSDVCSPSASTIRNVTVDLGTGTATVAGEVYVSALNTWQPIAALVSLTAENQIQIDGVTINGTLFAIPDNDIGRRIREAQTVANQAIAQLSIQTNGNTYRLSDIIVTETQLVATFR